MTDHHQYVPGMVILIGHDLIAGDIVFENRVLYLDIDLYPSIVNKAVFY